MRPKPVMPSSVRLPHRLWRSIFPTLAGHRDTTTGSRLLRNTLPFHFRPRLVEEKTLLFSLSWGLGGMAATLVCVLMATGILLKFIYVPTPIDAYASVQRIVNDIPFGRLVRNLHCWCANVLVVVLWLHMLRVFFTGAFHFPRQFNWIIGLVLFSLVLAANVCGYLLPYDQLAYWAVTVIVAMMGYLPVVGQALQQALGSGGGEIGPRALAFFYALHTTLIPLSLAGLMGFHFWRIRKAGGLVVPRPPARSAPPPAARIAAFPHLLIRETATAVALVSVMLMVSIFFDAPLAAPANPGLSPNPVRAPWYFAGFQEMLLHIHPALTVSLIPTLIAVFLFCIPYLPYPQPMDGIWFVSVRGRKQTAAAAVIAMLLTPMLIAGDTLFVKPGSWATDLSPMITDGLLPLTLAGSIITGLLFILKRRYQTSLNEAVQFLFAFMMASAVVFTLMGVYFRGPFMQLTWPW